MEISKTKIRFAVYIFNCLYVIKSQYGHYLGKDGLIHDDAVENCQWDDRGSAGDFLGTWNSLHDFNRTEILTPKKVLYFAGADNHE